MANSVTFNGFFIDKKNQNNKIIKMISMVQFIKINKKLYFLIIGGVRSDCFAAGHNVDSYIYGSNILI